MHIPVADHAGGVIVKPPKRAMKSCAVERTLGSRPQPAIVIDALGGLVAVGGLAASAGRFVAEVPGSGHADPAELSILHELDGLLKMLPRALLRADLADPLVSSRRVDHGPAFLDIVRDG